MSVNVPKPFVLAVLDGWGIGLDNKGNAITQAKTPYLDTLQTQHPNSKLHAHGEYIGMTSEKPASSHAGHLVMGTGQIVKHSLLQINIDIEKDTLKNNEALTAACQHLHAHKGTAHVLCLVNDNELESSTNHLYAITKALHNNNVEQIVLHLITDGKTSRADIGLIEARKINQTIQQWGARIGTIIGRYYAMDHEQRWGRTQRAYDLLVNGKGRIENEPMQAMQHAYDRNETDEFVSPIIFIDNPNDLPTIKTNDVVFGCNFEREGLQQLLISLSDESFKGFPRTAPPQNLQLVTLTKYSIEHPHCSVMYPPTPIQPTLSSILTRNGMRHIHISETHSAEDITYYFNGRSHDVLDLEDRIEVPSSQTTTFDQNPQMQADDVTEITLERIKSGLYSFIVINYPNIGLVGSTGNLEATKLAVQHIDMQIAQLTPEILKADGALLITSSYGKAERMINAHNQTVHTENTTNPVPAIYVNKNIATAIPEGELKDIPVTILNQLGVEIPPEMDGTVLFM